MSIFKSAVIKYIFLEMPYEGYPGFTSSVKVPSVGREQYDYGSCSVLGGGGRCSKARLRTPYHHPADQSLHNYFCKVHNYTQISCHRGLMNLEITKGCHQVRTGIYQVHVCRYNYVNCIEGRII